MRRLLAAALLALVFPAAASAHATLVRSSPSFQQRLKSTPQVVRLSFDQSVKALPNAIRVYSAKGRLLSGETVTSSDKRTIDAPVGRLPRGAYTCLLYNLTLPTILLV
jgi:methionine-rich copper-binding protein CopC